MKRLLRITSHAGHSRYLDGVSDVGAGGYIVRPEIPSPYSFSAAKGLYVDPARGLVFIVETAHKRYDVFAVPAGTMIYRTDEEATAAYIERDRAKRARLEAAGVVTSAGVRVAS